MTHVDIGEARLWVEDTGSGEPLVLLHAAAGHCGCWAEQRPRFEAAGYRVIAFDMRGFGRSESRAGYESSGSIAGDLELLTEKLSLDRFFLLGTAYGGFGALEFALDNPARLKGLVISTSFGGFTDAEFQAFRARHIRPDLEKLPTVVKELGASYRQRDPEGVKRFEAMEQGANRIGRQSLRTPTTLERLGSLAVPALVIAADEDLYAPPPVMKLFADRMPSAEFAVVQGAGHSAYWEQPEDWNRAVAGFLAKHR